MLVSFVTKKDTAFPIAITVISTCTLESTDGTSKVIDLFVVSLTPFKSTPSKLTLISFIIGYNWSSPIVFPASTYWVSFLTVYVPLTKLLPWFASSFPELSIDGLAMASTVVAPTACTLVPNTIVDTINAANILQSLFLTIILFPLNVFLKFIFLF